MEILFTKLTSSKLVWYRFEVYFEVSENKLVKLSFPQKYFTLDRILNSFYDET